MKNSTLFKRVSVNSNHIVTLSSSVSQAICIHRPPGATNLGSNFLVFGVARGAGADAGRVIKTNMIGENDYSVTISNNCIQISNLNIYASLLYMSF